jgi:Fe-Mn family superoxide dismutase
MFQTAMSIHGSGWVWLVVSKNSDLKVLATYNAGTPFDIRARQVLDPNTGWNLDSSGRFRPKQNVGFQVNRRHEYLILPILGLNVWEHAYVTDYGSGGKQQYLKNWWAAINWRRVLEGTVRRGSSRVSATI